MEASFFLQSILFSCSAKSMFPRSQTKCFTILCINTVGSSVLLANCLVNGCLCCNQRHVHLLTVETKWLYGGLQQLIGFSFQKEGWGTAYQKVTGTPVAMHPQHALRDGTYGGWVVGGRFFPMLLQPGVGTNSGVLVEKFRRIKCRWMMLCDKKLLSRPFPFLELFLWSCRAMP